MNLGERIVKAQENEMLVISLHIAMERLSQENTREGITNALQEIIASLVGSEELALYEAAPGTNTLLLTAACGVSPPVQMPAGAGVVGRVFAKGKRYVAPEPARPNARADDSQISVCVPLRRQGETLGALAIYGLLPSKTHLEASDLEVLNFLEKWLLLALEG